jgi:hypothetical protein
MSRSKKHTPVCSNTSSEHQKEYRTQENKAKRHRVNEILNHLSEVNNEIHQYLVATRLPDDKAYGNEWDSPRDGKHWLTKDLWKEQGYRYNRWMKK